MTEMLPEQLPNSMAKSMPIFYPLNLLSNPGRNGTTGRHDLHAFPTIPIIRLNMLYQQ
jgi:hypothetical protein